MSEPTPCGVNASLPEELKIALDEMARWLTWHAVQAGRDATPEWDRLYEAIRAYRTTMERRISALAETLRDCEEYFDSRADAEYFTDSPAPVPNEAMRMQSQTNEALAALLKSADIRSNIVERAWTSSRPKVAAGILRAIMEVPSVTASEGAFREFMKSLNRNGSGVLFEVMGDSDIDAFLRHCVSA